jgi:hypothetical protein
MKITPEMVSELDGGFKAMSDMLPPHWGSIYKGCLTEGFTEEQAMRLLLKYIEKACEKRD